MADYNAYQGDSLALITDTLGVDVAAYTNVTFVARNIANNSQTFSRAGSIVTPGTAVVSVQLIAADLAASGTWECAWRFDDGLSGTWTTPSPPKTLLISKAIAP